MYISEELLLSNIIKTIRCKYKNFIYVLENDPMYESWPITIKLALFTRKVLNTADVEQSSAVLSSTAKMLMIVWEMRKRMVVHALDVGVSDIILNTDIPTLPSDPPKFLKHSFIIESRKKGAPLFDDIVSIAGYVIQNDFHLFCQMSNGGMFDVPFSPKWGEADFSVVSNWIGTNDHIQKRALQKQSIKVFKFVLVFGALLEADSTPINVDIVYKKFHGKKDKICNAKKIKKYDETMWATYVIRLQSHIKKIYYDQSNFLDKSIHNSNTLDTTNLIQEPIVVRGHVKRVACGKKRVSRKWKYIAPYQSVRWVSKDVRIIVKE